MFYLRLESPSPKIITQYTKKRTTIENFFSSSKYRWLGPDAGNPEIANGSYIGRGCRGRKIRYSDYGFILVLIGVALALVVARVAFTPALVVPPVGPYVGP
jgi:hypothetical protein